MAKFYATTNPEKSLREVKNEQRSRQIAAQTMVLLKNDGILPLKSGEKLAIYGKGARHTIKGGTGSGDVNSREVITVEQGLKEAEFTVCDGGWLDKMDALNTAEAADKQKRVLEAMQVGIGEALTVLLTTKLSTVLEIEQQDIVTDCDTVIYVISRNSGEGFDRRFAEGDYLLSKQEEQNLQILSENYENIIVLLNVGGVMDTKLIRSLPKVKAILLMSQGGCQVGNALADVLTGKVTPSGHLTTTWAEDYTDYPNAMTFSHMNGDLEDEYYKEGIYVGYRYFDTFNVTPAYPFGYGLSYTDFDIEVKGVSCAGDKVTVTAKVTNTGDMYSGREVVQVYYSAPKGKLEKPYQELAGFAKTKLLTPGESQELTVTFSVSDMASYSEEKASYILESGTYYIRVGKHSRATRVAAALTLDREVVTQVLSNRISLDCEMELLSAADIAPYTYDAEDAEKAAAPVIAVDAAAIPCAKAVYSGEPVQLPVLETDHVITMDDVRAGTYTVEELAAQLTVEELAQICVGGIRGGFGAVSTIGAASVLCPGAAGDTTSVLLESRNVRNMVLADGPAGLRLSNSFMADAEDNLIPGTEMAAIPGLDYVFESMRPKEIPENSATYYQYTTAIPIATALAQTWDMEAVEAAGAIVGEEMKEFGVTLWLAPGMNIHRNPLCGRNFEYYSEDPLVSGLCAAADTDGVQKHGGIGTTIKHFAMNNQEDNRTFTNAHVAERTIREIYLKGFEIAVKRSQPLSIMTSYNLVNGTHTANSYDLITAIARDEWGFKGLVMTDWGTTGSDDKPHKYGSSNAAGCVFAGNDLTMPGSQEDVDEIVRSVGAAEGEVAYPLALGTLQSRALNILRVLKDSAAYEDAG